MKENPYAPPEVKGTRAVVPQPEKPQRGLHWTALLIGVAVDGIGAFLTGMVYGIFYAVVQVARGVPPQSIEDQLNTPAVLVPSLIIGFGYSTLGGFAAAWIARRSELLHGAMVGAVAVVAGLPFLFSVPIWYSVVSELGLIPAALLGAYAAKISQKAEVRRQK